MAKVKVIYLGRDILSNKFLNLLVNMLIYLIPMFVLINIPIFKLEYDLKFFLLFFLIYFTMEYCINRIFDNLFPKLSLLSFGTINIVISLLIVSFLSDYDFLHFKFENYIYLVFFTLAYLFIRSIIKTNLSKLMLKRFLLKNLKVVDEHDKNDSKEDV